MTNITNPFVYELDVEAEFVSIHPSKCVAKHIRLKTFKFTNTKTNMSKHSTNKQFRKKHNIKQPRGSMRHGSMK